MKKQITIAAGDPILNTLHFRPYQTIVERGVVPFSPGPEEEQTLDIFVPWGETLTAMAGDLIVYEIDTPQDRWPVKPDIFDATYIITRPGFCAKRAITMLVPMTELTGGDLDTEVVVQTVEGSYTVRAGDFYLAKGHKGEIWSIPSQKVESVMTRIDDI